MREGNLDRILSKIERRAQRLTEKLQRDLRDVKPFASREMTPDEKLSYYESLSDADRMELEQQLGARWLKFALDMERLKQRRQRYAGPDFMVGENLEI
jgi:iron uptake system EfeUOB component EfeO/EfeM